MEEIIKETVGTFVTMGIGFAMYRLGTGIASNTRDVRAGVLIAFAVACWIHFIVHKNFFDGHLFGSALFALCLWWYFRASNKHYFAHRQTLRSVVLCNASISRALIYESKDPGLSETERESLLRFADEISQLASVDARTIELHVF